VGPSPNPLRAFGEQMARPPSTGQGRRGLPNGANQGKKALCNGLAKPTQPRAGAAAIRTQHRRRVVLSGGMASRQSRVRRELGLGPRGHAGRAGRRAEPPSPTSTPRSSSPRPTTACRPTSRECRGRPTAGRGADRRTAPGVALRLSPGAAESPRRQGRRAVLSSTHKIVGSLTPVGDAARGPRWDDRRPTRGAQLRPTGALQRGPKRAAAPSINGQCAAPARRDGLLPDWTGRSAASAQARGRSTRCRAAWVGRPGMVGRPGVRRLGPAADS